MRHSTEILKQIKDWLTPDQRKTVVALLTEYKKAVQQETLACAADWIQSAADRVVHDDLNDLYLMHEDEADGG